MFTDGNNICLRLSEDPNEDEDDDADPVSVLHCLPPAQARALHEALGRALEEVDPRPVIDSISTTLAACSAPVPDILRKIDAACGESHLVNVVHGPDGTRVYRTPNQSAPDIIRVHPTGAGDHGSIDITTGNGLTRYAVQQAPRSLRSISTEELAKLGLKPKAHLPSDGYLLECGHWSIHKQWCTECAADIVAISQRASQPDPCGIPATPEEHAQSLKQKPSQPEPPPTGNGDLVTPPLLEALADYPQLAELVAARDAFGRAKYGTGLRTHNGRDPLEDGRQEIGDLLQYLWQAKMEGKDIGPLLKLCRNGLEVFEKPAPTLHPRPFWWDSSAAYGSVGNGGDFQMDLKYLLECAPTALDAHQSFQPCDPRDYPTFGIGPEFTGPRTLREYLEAP